MQKSIRKLTPSIGGHFGTGPAFNFRMLFAVFVFSSVSSVVPIATNNVLTVEKGARKLTDDELGTELVGCAMRVHSVLGPGLLESVYEACLMHELGK